MSYLDNLPSQPDFEILPSKEILMNRISSINKMIWGSLLSNAKDWCRLHPTHVFIQARTEEEAKDDSKISDVKRNQVDYDILPFEDFLYSSDLVIRGEEGEEARRLYNSLLIRVRDQSEATLSVALFMKSAETGRYDLKIFFDVNKQTKKPQRAYFVNVKGTKDFLLSMIPRAMETLDNFLYLFQSYEVEVISTSSPNERKPQMARTEEERARASSYIIDLCRKRKVPLFKSRKKGTSSRKGRHERIGYWRTSKNGIRHFVKSSVVSKDMPWAKNSKRYQL